MTEEQFEKLIDTIWQAANGIGIILSFILMAIETITDSLVGLFVGLLVFIFCAHGFLAPLRKSAKKEHRNTREPEKET